MSDEPLSNEVLQYVQAGQKIQAIKQLRDETGLGLKQAKDIVDRASEAVDQPLPLAPMTSDSTPWPKVIAVVLVGVVIFWALSTWR